MTQQISAAAGGGVLLLNGASLLDQIQMYEGYGRHRFDGRLKYEARISIPELISREGAMLTMMVGFGKHLDHLRVGRGGRVWLNAISGAPGIGKVDDRLFFLVPVLICTVVRRFVIHQCFLFVCLVSRRAF
jgi:hypothetical protein